MDIHSMMSMCHSSATYSHVETYASFPPFRCRFAVSLLPLHKLRKADGTRSKFSVQELVPESRGPYQKLGSKFCTPDAQETSTRNMAADASRGAGQSNENDELVVATAILAAISVKGMIKKNKHKRT